MDMNEGPLGFGAIRSPSDYRDSIASASVTATLAAVTLQPTFDTDLTKLGPVMMQGHQPACVSFAWVMVMKLYWYAKTGKVIDFEPRFLHANTAYPGGTPEDGRAPRDVAKASVTLGCCTTATLNGDVTMPLAQYTDKTQISAAAYAEALQYRLPGYISIPLQQPTVRAAIQLFGAASALFDIGSEFWLPSWADKDIDPLRTPATIVGGHELVLKGWVSDVLDHLRNHWSAAWANNGEANYGWAAWAPYIFEVWVPAEIPADTADFLKSLPSPSSFHYQWNSNLSYGMQNDDVKFAQIALMILGFLAPVDASDLGIYGPKTAAAVSKYQQAHKIAPAPNNIGPLTRTALNAQFAL